MTFKVTQGHFELTEFEVGFTLECIFVFYIIASPSSCIFLAKNREMVLQNREFPFTTCMHIWWRSQSINFAVSPGKMAPSWDEKV